MNATKIRIKYSVFENTDFNALIYITFILLSVSCADCIA